MLSFPSLLGNGGQSKARKQKNQSEEQKLKVVKEQILIRYLGLGWEKAHHPQSQAGRTFTPDELFLQLINVVIPLLG